jgi:hypothetical protein
MHRGKKSNAGTGALFGAAAGLVLGGIWGSGNLARDADGTNSSQLGNAALGALGYGLLGFFLGALIRTDRWEEVPLDRLRMSLAPQREAVAVALTVSF